MAHKLERKLTSLSWKHINSKPINRHGELLSEYLRQGTIINSTSLPQIPHFHSDIAFEHQTRYLYVTLYVHVMYNKTRPIHFHSNFKISNFIIIHSGLSFKSFLIFLWTWKISFDTHFPSWCLITAVHTWCRSNPNLGIKMKQLSCAKLAPMHYYYYFYYKRWSECTKHMICYFVCTHT